MKLTIIREDGSVYVDGVCINGLNLSFIPSDVHALQFNDASNAGWIEFVDNDFGEKPLNEKITTLPEWANTAITKWQEQKIIIESSKTESAEIKVTTV